MADANDALEQIKLLTDLGKTDSVLDAVRNQNQLSVLAAQVEQLEASQPRAPTQAQSARAQREAAEAAQVQQQATNSGVALLSEAYDKLGLNQQQGYASRLSGELGAVLAYNLGKDLQQEDSRNTEGSPRAEALRAALVQLDSEESAFRQQNPDAVHYQQLLNSNEDRVKDLASEDSFFDGVKKAAATAVAGIPGLAAIGASAAGLEGTGQFLGGVASGIQGAAPTDIQSSAAQQQFADIISRAETGEIPLGDAIAQGIQLGLTDGDFAGDLLANTVGAAAGGGVVRGAASLGARAAGVTAPRLGAIGSNAASAAPAIGVGLGAGVDENLTTGQARTLAATGAASAGLAGVLGATGNQVAESALGSLGRRLNPAAAPASVAPAASGALGQLGAGASGAVRTGGAEAAQEFVEGTGEALGGIAQQQGTGFTETLANPAARQQAITSGAIQAPLGAGLGAAVGAPAGIATARDANAEVAAIQQAQADQQAAVQSVALAENADRTAGIEGANIADQIAAQRAARPLDTNPLTPNEQAEAQQQAIVADELEGQAQLQQAQLDQRGAIQQLAGAEDQVRAEVQAEVERERVTAQRNAAIADRQSQLTIPVQLDANQLAALPLRDRPADGIQQTPYTLENLHQDSLDIAGTIAPLVTQDEAGVETELRALYRNQLQERPLNATPEGEDAFISAIDIPALQSISGTDTDIITTFRNTLDNAFTAAINVVPTLTNEGGNQPDFSQPITQPATQSATIDNIPTLSNTSAAETAAAPEPITAVQDIAADPEVPGVSPQALLQNTPAGNVLTESGRTRAEALQGAKTPVFQELSPKDRRSILSGRRGKASVKTIKDLLSKETLTPPEAGQLRDAVAYLEGKIAEKKPQAPGDGAARSSRSTAPVAAVRPTQGSVGSERVPASLGLLPDSDVSSQSQRFTSDTVSSSVAKLTQGWKRSPNIEVFPTTDSLPEGIRPTDGSLVAGRTDGNTVYLVADQITSEIQLNSVLQEELFHRGIRNSLGGNYDAQLTRVFNQRGGVNGLLDLAREYGADTNRLVGYYQDVIAAAQAGDKDAQVEFADEVLARLAQSPNLPSGIRAAIRRIGAQIKKYLKQFLPEAYFDTVTDADLILMMREATAAGRQPGEATTTIRSSRTQAGDYRGTNAAGERVIYNFLDNTERPETTAAQDNLAAARSQLDVTRNYFSNILDSTRADGLGQRIYRSTPWQGLMKRISDARTNLARLENEYKLLTNDQVDTIFDAVNGLEQVGDSPLLRTLLPGNSRSQKQATMSLHSAASTYTSRADYAAKRDVVVNENGDSLYDVMSRMQDAYRSYADVLGLKPTPAKQSITRYLNARHAAERNEIAWLKSGDVEPEARSIRDDIFRSVTRGTRTMEEALAEVRILMDQFALEERETYNGSGMTDSQAAEVISRMEANPEEAALLRAAAQSTYEVIQATNEVKRQTGSYSNSFDQAIRAYGWQNYVPLRGRGSDLDDSDDVFVSHYADNVFSSTFRPFQGRESITEDVFENVQKIAVSAIEQHAAQDFVGKVAVHALAADQTPEYRNAFQRDGFNGRLLAGSVSEVELNGPEFKAAMAAKDRNLLVYYDPANAEAGPQDVQRALLIRLEDERGTDAVLGAKSERADAVDSILRKPNINGVGIHEVTATTASLKTWRNPAFIPFDALRNILTLGYVSATEQGLSGLRSYVNQLTEPGLTNYASDIYRFANLYGRNQFDEIEALVASEGPNSTIAELDQFFRLGGPTVQLAALRDTPPGSIESLSKFGGIGDKGILKSMDEIFIPLNAAADTLSRFAFYKSLVDQGVEPGVAAARAKNTANFEQRGTWSGPLGGVLEFARATSVGASALINSTLTGEYGRETMAAAFGSGVVLYTIASLFAGTDDEGDDRMAAVNGKLYSNNFVFQYGDDTSDRLQVGLGFGPIAGAMSAGMQAARYMMGHQSVENTLDNMVTGMSNQYQVIPTSGISPLTDPVSFVANTAVPSILKPIYEVSTNMTGLGIPVRTDYPGADSGDMTDSFEGRYNSEQEMYEQITQALSNGGVAELNPDNLRHIMRSYGGTMSHLLESVFENIKYATSDEDYAYNKKAGFYFARNFIGSEFNQIPSDFYEHYGRMSGLDKRAKGLESRGETEAARAITDSTFYRDNLQEFKAAQKALRQINSQHKEVFRLGTTTLAEKRNTQAVRDAQRMSVFNSYLERVQN